MTVRVGKSGVFRAFGDDHEIRGSIKDGFVDEDEHTVDILIDAQRLQVRDPQLSPKDRDEVQTRMLSAEVLDVSQFPDIHFVSRTAEKTPDGWNVQGDLTLHGQTRPVSARVAEKQGRYTGTVRFKQTEFGITPVTVAGGTVKVKDELTIEFDIVTRAP